MLSVSAVVIFNVTRLLPHLADIANHLGDKKVCAALPVPTITGSTGTVLAIPISPISRHCVWQNCLGVTLFLRHARPLNPHW
jgi:hypothetical protein